MQRKLSTPEFVYFFFSSRRRHTRCLSDWSSDVCSSDLYCWTLLNVVQPSYGWTRTLLVPDPEHGLQPVASSHQLRVFGAYTRRVRAGMKRVKAASSNPHVLATALDRKSTRLNSSHL